MTAANKHQDVLFPALGAVLQSSSRGKQHVTIFSHLKCNLSNQRHWRQTRPGQNFQSRETRLQQQYSVLNFYIIFMWRGSLSGRELSLQLNNISGTHETETTVQFACQNSTTSMLSRAASVTTSCTVTEKEHMRWQKTIRLKNQSFTLRSLKYQTETCTFLHRKTTTSSGRPRLNMSSWNQIVLPHSSTVMFVSSYPELPTKRKH